MKFEPAELRLMLNAALYALATPTDDLAVPMAAMEGLFDRPVKLTRTVRELERGQFLTFDPFAGVVRLRLKPILSALHPYGPTQELFHMERPLDVALASVERVIPTMVRPPDPAAPATNCLADPYILQKLEANPNGGRLRRELSSQLTWSSRAFHQYYRENPAGAREDLAWFLEARSPGARMNTHMNSLDQANRFKKISRNTKP